MTTNKKLLLVLSAALALCVRSVLAADTKSPSRVQRSLVREKQDASQASPKTRQARDKGNTVPFDASVASLRPGYLGHDPEAIFQTIAQRLPTKSEFETMEEWKARFERAVQRPLIGSVGINSTLAMTVNILNGGLKYDAEQQSIKLVAQILPSPHQALSRELALLSYNNVVALKRTDIEGTRSYVASNAFGAMRTVTATTVNRFDFVCLNIEDFDFAEHESFIFKGKSAIEIEFPMQPQKAKEVKESLRLLAVFSLESPYIYVDTLETKPTIDKPTDVTIYSQYLIGRASEFIFYNYKTGEIYRRLRPQSMKDKAEPEREPDR